MFEKVAPNKKYLVAVYKYTIITTHWNHLALGTAYTGCLTLLCAKKNHIKPPKLNLKILKSYLCTPEM